MHCALDITIQTSEQVSTIISTAHRSSCVLYPALCRLRSSMDRCRDCPNSSHDGRATSNGSVCVYSEDKEEDSQAELLSVSIADHLLGPLPRI